MHAEKLTTSADTQSPFQMAEYGVSQLINSLKSREAMTKEHSDIEDEIAGNLQDIAKLLLQGHLDARGKGNIGSSIKGADGKQRTHKRASEHILKSIFGEVVDTRIGYSHPQHESLFPKDASLNLPDDSYSHGLHRKLAKEAIRGSIDEAIESIAEQTGVKIPKRQALMIIENSSKDFDAFYGHEQSVKAEEQLESLPIQVLTTDGKGVVMRLDGLREATKEKRLEIEEEAINSGARRLKRGEKKNGKRMAQVASTYCIDRHIRKPEDIVRDYSVPKDINNPLAPRQKKVPNKKPKPVGKRVWASLEKDQTVVIEELFAEAVRRDPSQQKEWVGLVDGQKSQLAALQAEAEKHHLNLTVIVDIIHVIEYVWRASLAFHAEGSLEREWWVNERVLKILQGKATLVAAGICRSATRRELSEEQRMAADKCASYLKNNAPYLRYDKYLSKGYPIATGVIEGACRHLVKDRMDLTGARWSLKGGEAILKLRSIIKSGDFDAYWAFHLAEEYKRNHANKYSEPERLKHKGLMLVTNEG